MSEDANVDALRFRALAVRDGWFWSRVDGRYGVSHYLEYDEVGNIIGEHETLEDVADSLIASGGRGGG